MPAHAGPRFLVTGATGFIGSRLVSELIAEHGAEAITAMADVETTPDERACVRELKSRAVTLIQCDLLELPKLGLPVPEFDVVYHLAGFVAVEKRNPKIAVNTTGTTNLLDWLGQNLSGKRLVFSGTQLSVDRNERPTGPMNESTPCHPKTEYGRTKLEAERIIEARSPILHFDYTILRLSTIIGPGYRAEGILGRFQQLLAKNSLATRLNWPGRTSIICLSDVVDIMIAAPQLAETKNEVYHLSNGEDPTIDHLLDQISRILRLPRKKIAVPAWIWEIVWAITSFAGNKKAIPFELRVFLWRVSHMAGDGLYLDGSKLNGVLNPHYRSIEEGLYEAYGVTGFSKLAMKPDFRR